MHFPFMPLARACSVAVLACTAATAQATSADGYASINFGFQFNDAQSHVDLDGSGTEWIAYRFDANDKAVYLYNDSASGLVTARYEDNSGSTATSTESKFDSYGGMLSTQIHADGVNPDSSMSSLCLQSQSCTFAQTSLTGHVVLAPGAIAYFNASYSIAGTSEIDGAGDGALASGTAQFRFFPPTGASFGTYDSIYSSSPITPHSRSGLFSETFANDSSAPQIFDFTLLVDSSAGALLAAPVPEPQTWAMLLGGLLIVGAEARRRSVRRNAN